MNSDALARLFVSHHSSKSDIAEHISSLLNDRGVDCWMAPRDVEPGEPFDKAIRSAIGQCDGILLLFCGRSDKSRHVKRELILADTEGKPIIPVRLEDIAPDNLEYFLADSQWIDWIERRDEVMDRIAVQARRFAAPVSVELDLSIQSDSTKSHGTTKPEKASGLARIPDFLASTEYRKAVAIGKFAALILLATLVALKSWDIPVIANIERSAYDLRAAYAAEMIEPDNRIVLITYTEETLVQTGQRSPLDREILARALPVIDAMNPRALGIDILFDQPTTTADDALLVDALRALHTPTRIAALNGQSENEDPLETPVQNQFQDRFFSAIGNERVSRASPMMSVDEDNVLRSWSPLPPSSPPLMAQAFAPESALFEGYEQEIAFRRSMEPGQSPFVTIPIEFFTDPATASHLIEFIEHRYVIIGADLVDYDRFRTPLRIVEDETLPGIEIQAHLLAQLLDRNDFQRIPAIIFWLLAILAIGIAFLLRAIERKGLRIASAAILGLMFPFSIFLLQLAGVGTLGFPMLGLMLAVSIAYFAAFPMRPKKSIQASAASSSSVTR